MYLDGTAELKWIFRKKMAEICRLNSCGNTDRCCEHSNGVVNTVMVL
jgi:hypothetical protein